MITNNVYIILDVGGTFIKSAVLQPNGNVCAFSSSMDPSHSEDSAKEVEEVFIEVIQKRMAYCENHHLLTCGIGICIPGPFDYKKGIALMKHKFQSLYGKNLKEYINAVLHLDKRNISLWFVHDVNAMLAGELWKGRFKSFKNVVLVAIGTGLGFACTIDGRIQQNEMGAPKYSMFSRPYNDGVLEDYISKKGIIRLYKELQETDCSITVKEIGQLAAENDANAIRTYRNIGKILAQNIHSFLNEKKIECLLFGGQISRSLPIMKEIIQKELADVQSLRLVSEVSDIEKIALWGTLTLK